MTACVTHLEIPSGARRLTAMRDGQVQLATTFSANELGNA
jgi:hypothetical protein